MSGSDIKEACRDAAMGPVREYIQVMKKQGRLKDGVNARDVRGVRTSDFFGKADSPNAQYAGVQKPMNAVMEADEVQTDGEDDGYETTSEDSDPREKELISQRRKSFERQRERVR